MGNFTQIPNELFESDLTALEKLVWIVIKKHDWNGGGSWPSASMIAKESSLHRSTILRLVASLEEKGVVSVIRTHGRVNRYAMPTGRTELPVAENDRSQRTTNPSQRTTGVVAENDPNNTKEKDTRKRHNILSPKDQIEKSRKKAEDALDALDLDKFREKYPTIDVEFEHQQCKDHHLAIQANYHGPKKRTDWSRTFHTWCRNQVKWKRDRSPPLTARNFDWRLTEEDIK